MSQPILSPDTAAAFAERVALTASEHRLPSVIAACLGAVMVERHIRGDEHRLLVIGGKLVAATRGESAWITGDGRSTVAELIDREPDPAHAVIGLRNHGITATGDSLTEILDRIQVDILRQVPMT